MNQDREYEIKAGFLIVKTYNSIYRDYVNKYNISNDFYGLPRKDKTVLEQRIQYRGLDRDALGPFDNSDILAEHKMYEFEKIEKCVDGFFFDECSVDEIFELLEEKKDDYEIVWTRVHDSVIMPPKNFISIGFEPTYFQGDHFSASSDCMIIPRWHGTDDEGTLFLGHFNKLNKYGLFKTVKETKEFLNYYLSFDWTETGEYEIAEIFISNKAQIVGKPLVIDEKAKSANKKLPAFLSKPKDAPVYHGFPLLKESETDGWILGVITEFEDENGCSEGDAYVVSPSGERIGLVWDVGEGEISMVCEPDNMRLGVFQVWFPKIVKSKKDMVDNFRHILPILIKKYTELKINLNCP